MKFLVRANVGYVVGHLRYGHLEGEVEAESEEALKEMMKDKYFGDWLNLVVDGYSVDDVGDVGEYKYEVIE